jgi:hypothetical protein
LQSLNLLLTKIVPPSENPVEWEKRARVTETALRIVDCQDMRRL